MRCQTALKSCKALNRAGDFWHCLGSVGNGIKAVTHKRRHSPIGGGMTGAVIELKGVDKSFGNREVLRQLDLSVPEHSLFAFLGNNGHGKSTTIRLITGLLKADRGDIRVLGLDIKKQRRQVLEQIGCLIDYPSLYPNLNAVEFLSIGCTIKGLALLEIDRVLELVNLRDAKKVLIAHYSLGMKQRLALAHALLGQPRLLILDEPTNGLDPEGINDIRRLLMHLPTSANCSIFFSSHQLDEVEKTASHLALLRNGSVQFQAAIGDLKAQHDGFLSMDVCDADKAHALLEGLGFLSKKTGANTIRISSINRQNAAQVHTSLIHAGLQLFESTFQKPSLEQWFLQSTVSAENEHAD